jgi:hypothetical protein
VPDESHAGWPARAAVAIVRSDPPQVFLAQDPEVLSRLVALQVVARAEASELSSDALQRIREALLSEHWAPAVAMWIEATGEAVDAYPDEVIWSDRQLDAELASLEIRLQPIFEDRPAQ